VKEAQILRSFIVIGLVLLGITAGSATGACQNGAGAIVAIDEAAGSTNSIARDKAGASVTKGHGSASKSAGQIKGPKASGSKASPKAKPSVTSPDLPRSATPRLYNGPVLGDKYTFLNFEVVSAEKPIYRRIAKQAGASGLVQVEVLIETDGSVLSAKARTGNKLLWDEAERAALASKFNRPTDNGRPARAIGFLVYRFGAAEDDDDSY
jgi:hypothetical protein